MKCRSCNADISEHVGSTLCVMCDPEVDSND